MGYHPEDEKGWTEGLVCPYCKKENVVFKGNTERVPGSGDCDYAITEGLCEDCGKKIMIVETIYTDIEGCFMDDEEE